MGYSTGNFGAQAEQYDKARPNYPTRVFTLIKPWIKPGSWILDVGCGTGISTRQLAERLKTQVVGCDVDLEMLKMAVRRPSKGVAYALGDARALPFDTGAFDCIAAFTAFHWFADTQALKEIRRVLKKDGILVTVQPRLTAPFAPDIRTILQQELRKDIPATYAIPPFQQTLQKGKFTQLDRFVVKDVHAYSLDEYLILVQSYSIWNEVPLERRGDMLRILRTHFETKLKNGVIRDTRDVEVLIVKR